MIDTATRNILLELLRREMRSLMMYASEAFPWTTPEEQNVLAEVLKMVKEEEAAAIRLARFLQKQRTAIPPLGAYPVAYTTMNFISLDYTVPLLIEQQKRRIEELAALTSQVANPQARAHLQELIDLKKRHTQILEGIHGKRAAA